ncbi:hypothetical protein ACFQ3Y_24855 [Paenibacillus motobuensis]|uniref:hypothetical protein n=1 Tax=Paenibacillus motobuensis TaxID=295324 RepID=UPI003625C2CB
MKIDGRRAEITHELRYYRNWTALADKYGYPKAAYDRGRDPRSPLSNGDIVTLLTSTYVHDSAMMWIVQASNGEQFIYSEKGLRILDEQITVLPDESLGGVLREYREVKRKADVGECVKVIAINPDSIKVGNVHIGEIFTVAFVGSAGDIWEVTERKFSGILSLDWEGLREYVVLEPTDILVINGERLRMVDRKATLGERVIIVNHGRESSDGHYYRIGNVGAVLGDGITPGNIRVDFSGNADYYGEGRWSVSPGDYRVLEPASGEAESATPLSSRPSSEQAAENIAALQAQNVALAAQVTELESRLNALYEWHKRAAIDLRVAREDIVLIEEGVADDIAELRDKVAALEYAEKFRSVTAAVERAQKSPQEIRDEIVERAKADVKSLQKTDDLGRTAYRVDMYLCDVEFVVNREKQTVAAILRWRFNGEVKARGVAKCAPNDVFNAHIGKAIALRRALGLEVPAEYFSAPNPTDVRVGHVVTFNDEDEGSVLYRVDSLGRAGFNCTVLYDGWFNKPGGRALGGDFAWAKIVDDTREGDAVPSSSAQKGAAA